MMCQNVRGDTLTREVCFFLELNDRFFNIIITKILNIGSDNWLMIRIFPIVLSFYRTLM